ncbi:tyrosine-protein phosphatase [Telluribacter sp.]|jgi:tyrosine-protein phosphatase YwqE|uniref:tyrosine-protein phosphatase n=1 Tax=Telluribacter sp. TaxID=1978767 RepID=UPI002E149447|nr:CpsB/CapC family capsule biosynthesis tyrosine phosphatase [Telluribacter sp.]
MTFSFLSRKPDTLLRHAKTPSSIKVDVHAHILPGLDNGALLLENSVRMARALVEAGITRVVATPHIMKGYYENSLQCIRQARWDLEAELRNRMIPLTIDLAAEYYVGPELYQQVRAGEPLLTFGVRGQKPFLLMETGLLEEPAELEKLVYSLTQRNIVPLLAHPERYLYLQKNFERAIDLFRMGVLFQVDWQTFHPQGDRQLRQFAERLVDYRMVSFVGTNLQGEDQVPLLYEAACQPYFRLMTEIGLLNNELR